MERRHVRTLVTAVAAAAVVALGTPLALAGPAAAGRHSVTPHITARPSTVKVNRTTLLTGTGFKGRELLTVSECAAKLWIVPRDICTNGNVVTVRASRHGTFRVRFRVRLCPVKSRIPAASGRTCYIGVPTIDGVDVVQLSGAVRITVARP